MGEQHGVAQPGCRGDQIGGRLLQLVVGVLLDEDLAQPEQERDAGTLGQAAPFQGGAQVG